MEELCDELHDCDMDAVCEEINRVHAYFAEMVLFAEKYVMKKEKK